MKLLWWVYSVAIFGIYAGIGIFIFQSYSNPDFNIFLAYLGIFILAAVDSIILDRLSNAMFDKTVVFILPEFLRDYLADSRIATLVCIVVMFLASPIIALANVISHIIGMVKCFTE